MTFLLQNYYRALGVSMAHIESKGLDFHKLNLITYDSYVQMLEMVPYVNKYY